MRSEGQSGQVTVLVLGLALVVFAVAGLAVDGTRAFLYRRSLQNLADSAALAGASMLDTSAYYGSGGNVIALDRPAAVRRVNELLSRRPIPQLAEVSIQENAVELVVRGYVPTTFLGLVGIARIPVAVEARAEPIRGSAP